MPFATGELLRAHEAFKEFLSKSPPSHHARFVFPFFAGSYFAYRKVDVLRTVSIAMSLSRDPSYIDFGCGFGDFLARVREYIPRARGIEKDAAIFSLLGVEKPAYIDAVPVESFSGKANVAFIGWMEPGTDFRRTVARSAECVITTFDAGGQCGIAGGCEYEEFGFERVARWRTPSWIDVNSELMNRYYTPTLEPEQRSRLASLRTAHNFWYVYAQPQFSARVKQGLQSHLRSEEPGDKYDFEDVLDECGFGYRQELGTLSSDTVLWEVAFG